MKTMLDVVKMVVIVDEERLPRRGDKSEATHSREENKISSVKTSIQKWTR
jgi:hypothetical protein